MPREKRPSSGEAERPAKCSGTAHTTPCTERETKERSSKEAEVEPERTEIEAIVGHKDGHRGVRKYLVKWKGCCSAQNTWVPIERVAACAKLPADYDRKFAVEAETKLASDSGTTKESEPNDKSSEHEVEAIVGYRDTYSHGRQYFIRWKGGSFAQGNWEPEKNLDNCQELLDEFWAERGGRIFPPVSISHRSAAKTAPPKEAVKPDSESKLKTRITNLDYRSGAKCVPGSSKDTRKSDSPAKNLSEIACMERPAPEEASETTPQDGEFQDRDGPEEQRNVSSMELPAVTISNVKDAYQNVTENVGKNSALVGPADACGYRRCASLCSRQAKLYDSKEATDFILVSSDKRQFPVHRFVLLAHSPVLSAMVSRGNADGKNVCEIADLDGETVDILLEFLYSGSTRRVKERPEQILEAADKYDVEDLLTLAIELLSQNLTVSTAVRLLDIADRRTLTALETSVTDYIVANLESFDRVGGYEKLSQLGGSVVVKVLKAVGKKPWMTALRRMYR